MRFNSDDQGSRWNQDKRDDDKRDGFSKRIVPNPRSRHPLMLWIIVSFIIFMGFQLYFQRKGLGRYSIFDEKGRKLEAAGTDAAA